MTKKIMLIRHAEKPDKLARILGVSPQGEKDKESLSVRGWQRAGALVRFFAPVQDRFTHEALATPQYLFSCKVLPDNPSRRPMLTLQPLAEFLRTEINLEFAEGNEADLIEAARAAPGHVLISCKHNMLPIIGKAFSKHVPEKWPADCFDKVWVFTGQGADFAFTEVPQSLLPGDTP